MLSPYALRHLWISEALMAGLDTKIVARLAGTSTAMVERVYGPFRAQSLADAEARLDRERASRGLLILAEQSERIIPCESISSFSRKSLL